MPERAHQAACAACGRAEHGAYPPPGIRYPRADATAARSRPACPVQSILAFTVVCERCEWTGRVRDGIDAWLALRVHDTVTHDPGGWLSGVRGGINDPWGRRR